MDPGQPSDHPGVPTMLVIGGYGVMGTPALIINGEVKSVGKVSSKDEIKGWITK